MVNWQEHGTPFLDFTEEITQKWIERGFNKDSCKKLLDIGLKVRDYDCAYWLEIIKDKDNEWVLRSSDHENSEQLREEYENFLEELTSDSKLSKETLKKIKDITYWRLARKKKSLIEKFLPSEELRGQFKQYGLCFECHQPNTGASFGGTNWCQSCNAKHFAQDFDKWTSGNPEIDKLIQKRQLEANNFYEVLEWIPYDRFTDVEYLAEGGFGKVYKAKWANGAIKHWNVMKNRWERRYESRLAFGLHLVRENAVNEMNVALKVLNNSQDVTTDFLREVTSYKLFDNMNLDKFNSLYITKCHGISQDPATENYIMVIDYMKDGNLRNFLGENYGELKFIDKLNQFSYIISGLEYIHKQGLVHRDFHPGNILSSSNGANSLSYARCYITDLGLCQPVNENNKGKIYGVLPYIAPEVLMGEPYSQVSDIYASGIIAYEIFSGCPPHSDINHDYLLSRRVCEGLRPNLDKVTAPQMLKDLISRCWDADPSRRPSASELSKTLKDWKDEKNKDTEFSRERNEIEKIENIELSGLLSRLYQQLKGRTREINADEKLREIKHELFLEFCRKQYKHKKYASLEWEVKKTFSKLLYPSISNQIHSNSVYTSRLLDFPNLPEPQNNPSKEWQTSTLLELRIKGIKEELTLLKIPFEDSEEGELIDNFVRARKKMTKDKHNKQAKKEAGNLEEQLEEKGLVTEDIERLIKYCEEWTVLEQQLEKVQLAQVEVTVNK